MSMTSRFWYARCPFYKLEKNWSFPARFLGCTAFIVRSSSCCVGVVVAGRELRGTGVTRDGSYAGRELRRKGVARDGSRAGRGLRGRELRGTYYGTSNVPAVLLKAF